MELACSNLYNLFVEVVKYLGCLVFVEDLVFVIFVESFANLIPIVLSDSKYISTLCQIDCMLETKTAINYLLSCHAFNKDWVFTVNVIFGA